MASASDSANEVRSVSKALRLVSALAEAGHDAGVHELARSSRQHAATVHRLLRTLVAEGVVEQDTGSTRYRLGPLVLRWADAYTAATELQRVARPLLEGLAAETGETVHLMVLSGDCGVYVDRVDSMHRLRVATAVGHREPLHCSGVGKALLAFMPVEAQVRVVASGLQRYTPRTVTDAETLAAHLARVRDLGYAVDDGEGVVGVRCVGAPLLGRGGRAVAAISVAAPAARLPCSAIPGLAERVVAAAAAISCRLGYECPPRDAAPDGHR